MTTTQVLCEFNNDYSMLSIHGRTSLSSLVEPLMTLSGVILVTQTNYNDLEIYLAKDINKGALQFSIHALIKDFLHTTPEFIA